MMVTMVPNLATMAILREALEKEGYDLNPEVRAGDPGVDIVARRGDVTIDIDVIGLKANLSNRARDFFKAFFQALARIGAGSKRVAIAMPVGYEGSLPLRASNRGVAWTRLGDAFPELELWLVDTTHGTYRVTRWNEWARTPPPSSLPAARPLP